ncbi:MAG: HAMP domain-containing histidine kinase [Clostridia bacterium]|nr:HAMP domain-containing histidine kinase [Clostridia bacterium]
MKLKKTVIICILTLIIFLAMITVSTIIQYKIYTKNFNLKIAQITKNILDENPNIKKQEIVNILNSKDIVDNNILLKYGIELSKDSAILENYEYFKIFILFNIGIVGLLWIILIIIIIKYKRNNNKAISEITKYIEELNQRNYSLKIETNTEGELSILRNEIYKITVMLKEIAENSKQDKINLKDSLSDISHQLRTPLTSINIMLDNILENNKMEEVTRIDFLKDIKREIVNINFFIEAILKLSKFDANTITFIKKEVYIKDIINEAIKNVEALSDLKNVEIVINGDSNLKLECDLKWQVEAITNILKNGIEHSRDYSRIIINFEEYNVYSQIEIIDEGYGIDKEDLPHIFKRFYQGKNSSGNSIGIGLALSKSIIENSDGYIEVESEINIGTKFVIKYVKY